jgi:AAA+ ATPase superfamily predicted ATPase
MQQPFIDRQRELGRFDRYWLSGRAEFLALTGRRRVGKSRLLEHYFADKPHVHIVGTAQTARIQLADATRELARATADPVLAHQALDNWEAFLAAIAERARDRRFGVIIDEFSYYCDQSPELPSLLQRWWDQIGQRTQVVLVLASSHVAFMGRLLRGDQPLYGRRTGEFRLQPFDYFNAARFFPAYSAADRLRAYGIFGGMPAYLAACDPEASLAVNIRQRVLEDDAYLRREPLYLLAQERSVNQPAAYLSLLRAIADGQTQPNLIAMATGARSPADIAPTLERLQEFGLVERVRPVTAEPGGRISRYIVADPFLAFWFRFVQPAEALLERGFARRVLDDLFAQPEGLDRFFSRAQGPWEQACAEYLWRALGAGMLGELRFDRLGPWWEGRGATASVEIDLAGRAGQRTTLVASCKWRNEWMKSGDLDDLRRDAARLGADERTRYVLFSRSGFDSALVARAELERVLLVTPETMFSASLDSEG